MGKRVGMEVSLAIGEAAKMADVDVIALIPSLLKLTSWSTWQKSSLRVN